jgi:hypothetical protein
MAARRPVLSLPICADVLVLSHNDSLHDRLIQLAYQQNLTEGQPNVSPCRRTVLSRPPLPLQSIAAKNPCNISTAKAQFRTAQ